MLIQVVEYIKLSCFQNLSVSGGGGLEVDARGLASGRSAAKVKDFAGDELSCDSVNRSGVAVQGNIKLMCPNHIVACNNKAGIIGSQGRRGGS